MSDPEELQQNIAQALRVGSHVIKKALRTDNVQDVKAAWEILDRHIERLADLSMDVLSYDPVVRERAMGGNLNKLVEHVVELFREEARARAIKLTLRRGRDLDSARFDPMSIYRCLVNLVSNALDACPLSEGLVRIATKRTNEKEFMISVADIVNKYHGRIQIDSKLGQGTTFRAFLREDLGTV